MSDYQMQEVFPAPDDTFLITVEFLGNERGKCYHISRVFAFGVMRSTLENMCTFIAPIDGNGMPLSEDSIQMEVFTVCGKDIAPNGKPWIAVYNAIVPTGYDRRELPPGVFDDQYDPAAWNSH